MTFEDDSKKISKYNDASFSISRLHENWLRCYKYMRSGNFKSWKYELDLIWLELFPDILRMKNNKSIKIRNRKLRKEIALSKDKSKLFFKLMQRHEFLREIQDASGKGGVYIDEDEERME